MSPDKEVAARPRPRIHFTAESGWINDPYGVVWSGNRYHLFYQAIPGRTTWAPTCHWGHAESSTLVGWREQSTALAPGEFETGCWSGSVVPDPPTIFYTRVTGRDWGCAGIAAAYGTADLRTWRSDPGSVVIDGAPAGLGVHTFRDPFVFRHDGAWTMIVGAGLDDGSAAALQYRSADLSSWSFTGILCSGLDPPSGQVSTGALWECPQLFPLAGRWVLLVSVSDGIVLDGVAAAIGEYDGERFLPQAWQRLTYGTSAYAMTAFTDRQGQRCAVSWLREEPQNDESLSVRAGAHSLPALLDLTPSGRLTLRPHQDVDALRRPMLGESPASGEDAVELVVPARTPTTVHLAERERARAEIAVLPAQRTIRVVRPGYPPGVIPLGAEQDMVRIIVDADIVEIFASAYGAFRIRPAHNPRASAVLVAGSQASRYLLVGTP